MPSFCNRIMHGDTLAFFVSDQPRMSREFASLSEFLLRNPHSQQDNVSHNKENDNSCHQNTNNVSCHFSRRVCACIKERIHVEPLCRVREVGQREIQSQYSDHGYQMEKGQRSSTGKDNLK